MPFCASCGQSNAPFDNICHSCLRDPKVPEPIMMSYLEGLSGDIPSPIYDLIPFPGEMTSLAFSIFVTAIISLVLSTVSLGIFAVLIVITILTIKIRGHHLQVELAGVSDKVFPKIFRLSQLAAYRLRIPLVRIYVSESSALSAYTSGFWGSHWIVLSEGIIKALEPEELLFVIGHEMGHVKRQHVSWQILAGTQPGLTSSIISPILRLIFNNWSLKAEYTADRAGLIACQNPDTPTSALLKIVTGKDRIDLETYLKKEEKASEDILHEIAEYASTHPYTAKRIKQIKSHAIALGLDMPKKECVKAYGEKL